MSCGLVKITAMLQITKSSVLVLVTQISTLKSCNMPVHYQLADAGLCRATKYLGDLPDPPAKPPQYCWRGLVYSEPHQKVGPDSSDCKRSIIPLPGVSP